MRYLLGTQFRFVLNMLEDEDISVDYVVLVQDQPEDFESGYVCDVSASSCYSSLQANDRLF